MSLNTQKPTVLVIQAMKDTLINDLEQLKKEEKSCEDLQVVLISSKKEELQKYETSKDVTTIPTTFDPSDLAAIFTAEFKENIKAVICRGDMYVQYLRKVVPFLPEECPVSSEEVLARTTNKRLMRAAFAEHCPEITPHYQKVVTADEYTNPEYWASFQFPVIIKPASLASSILIQKCESIEDVVASLENTFTVIQDVYNKEGRSEEPEVIVEEFLEGRFFSIDSYVLEPNQIFHLPPVEYLPAEKMGIDDFFLYKRWLPVDLSDEDIAAGYEAATKAVKAVGLRFSSAHIEMVLTITGWKIIEIGPRIGRFRNIMYKEAFGINHGLNDLRIHLGLLPQTDTSKNRYVSAYSIYPHSQGVFRSITQLDQVSKYVNINYKKYNAIEGEVVFQAKNGGHSLYEIVFSNDTKEQHDSSVAWFEDSVAAVVDKLPLVAEEVN